MDGMGKMAVGLAITVLTVAVIASLAPAIGGQMETATPTLAADSDWNQSHQTNLQTGGQFFATNFVWVGLLLTIVVAAVGIKLFSNWGV